jgi:hypothetical protein
LLSEDFEGEAMKVLSGINGSKRARMSKSQMKIVLITFFDIKGLVRFEFTTQGQTVSQAYYVEML